MREQISEFEKNLDLYLSVVHILGKQKGEKVFCTSGSGCLIKYNNKCFLLTAAHVVSKRDGCDYFLEIRFDSDKGETSFLQLNGSWKIKRFCLTSEEVSNFDFAFYEIPCEIQPPYLQLFKEGVSDPVKEYPKTIHQIDFDVQPEPIGKYAFAGLTRPETVDEVDGVVLNMEYTVEVSSYAGRKDSLDIKSSKKGQTAPCCSGTNYVTDVYVFEPDTYRGDEYYQGCSGSPIMDTQNRVVSILIAGCSLLKQIYGVRLVAFKPIFEDLTKPT